MNTTAEADSSSSITRGGKGGEIVRCLGYRHFHQDDNIDVDGVIGDILRAAMGAQDNSADNDRHDGLVDHVDLWHLRTLAIQPGGLILSFGRKSGWIKLAGVDELVFKQQGEQNGEENTRNACGKSSSSSDRRSYEEIQRQLGQEMEPSLWHIQRERRRLRKNERKSFPSNFSSSLSQASSMTDLSSYGGSTNGGGTSGSSTPLTCNLNSRTGTPKSVSFGMAEKMAVPAGAPLFTAFANKSYRDMSSVSSSSFHRRFGNTHKVPSSFEKENEENGSAIDPSPLPSPAIMPSPAMPLLPPSLKNNFNSNNNNCGILKANSSPYIPYQSNISLHHQHHQKPIKARAVKKDKRPKERKLLIQIASSAFYLIEQQQQKEQNGGGELLNATKTLSYYPGMQDLIAILLLHLESPSLASLLLRQIIESHLGMFCIEYDNEKEDEEEEVNSGEDVFHSCVDEPDDDDDDEGKDDASISSSKCLGSDSQDKSWDLLSLSFFPVLKLVDEELYSSLTAQGLLNNRVFVFAEVLKQWISSWFCSQEDLPLEVVSRIIDFFLASHPSMPLYLSIAIVCHPVNRDKFLLPSLEPSPTAASECNIFNQTSEDDADSLNDDEAELQPAQISPRKPSSPRDRHISEMLNNLFTDLAEELSTANTHPNPFASDVENYSLDERVCSDSIITFLEQAIGTATVFMKQVPPHSLRSLVKGYNDGFLLSYLDPREHAQSFSAKPWSLRATAPTDHNLAQRVANTAAEADVSPKAFTMPKALNEKHQIALDASGLDLNKHRRVGWEKIQRNKMTILKVFLIGLTLCFRLLNQTSKPCSSCGSKVKSLGNDMNKNKPQPLFDLKTGTGKPKASTPSKKDTLLGDDFASTLGQPKPSFTSDHTPPAKITEKKPTFRMPATEADNIKQADGKDQTTPKEDDTPLNEWNTKTKQRKPSNPIIRTVQHIIKAAICVATRRCDG